MTVGAQLRRHSQVILALLVREEQLRKSNPGESILDMLEPVCLIGLLSLAWWYLGTKNNAPFGGSPVLFYASGFFPKYFFIYLSRRMRGSVETPRRRFPVENRLDYITVHLILRTIDYTVLGVVVFGTITIFFTSQAIPYDTSPIFESLAAIIMLGFGWGILNLVATKAIWFWPYFFPAFNRALLLFSGVFFVVDYLPPNIRYVLSFNPMLHAIALFRTGFYPNYPLLLLDREYMWLCAIGFVLFGFLLERLTRRSESQ